MASIPVSYGRRFWARFGARFDAAAVLALYVASCGTGVARAASDEVLAVPGNATALVEEASTASDISPPGGRRSYLQSAMNKVRPASLLRLDAPPVGEAPELRSALGRRRDTLLGRHYARLAELDALADEAGRGHDLRLAEQIEAARRRDTQQFFLDMQALKVQVLAAWSAGGP